MLNKKEIQEWVDRWKKLNQTPRVKATIQIWSKLL